MIAVGRKEILCFTFSGIKLGFFWHRISGLLFIVTVSVCFLLFFNHYETQRTTGSVNGATKTGNSNMCTLTLFSGKCFLKYFFWNKPLKKNSSTQFRTQNSLTLSSIYRSSGPEVFLGKGVLNIFSKVTGEHPCRSVIFNNVALHLLHYELVKMFWSLGTDR